MDLRRFINLFTEQTTPPKPNVGTAAGYKGTAGAQAIQAASGVKDVNKIRVGQTLTLPGGGTYQVQKGDTLDKIAKRQPPPAATAPAPAPTAQPTASATASAASDDAKRAAIGGTQPQPVDAMAGADAGDQTSSGYSAQSQAQRSAPDAMMGADAGDQTSSGYSAQSQAQRSAPDAMMGANAGDQTSSGYSVQSQAQKSPDVATGTSGYTGGTTAPSNQGGYAASGAPTAAQQATAEPPNTVRSTSGAAVTSGGKPVTSRDFNQPQFGSMGNRLNEYELDEESLEEQLESDLAEMMRLSGMPLSEKAVSKQQQKFMGMVHAMQKGEKVKGASPELKKVAKTMGKKDAEDFASTKHKGLPQKVSESVMLEAGSNLEHIVTRFKHETKRFLNGEDLDDDLYNALYDFYVDNGEMPYGVAKAREGDPYQWVGDRFESELAGMGYDRKFNEAILPEVDSQLSELARLAGLSESTIEECGDMGMDQQGRMNISTNMSSDGTKSVTISAQGDEAEALIQMLKLAGMGGSDRPTIALVSNDEEMMDEEREPEYPNTPAEEYQTVDSIIHQGNDLNREKRQYADKPKLGDNPMAEEVSLDEELASLLDSVLVREQDPRRPKGDTGKAEIFTADLGINPPSPDEGPVGAKSIKPPAAPSSPAMPRPGVKK